MSDFDKECFYFLKSFLIKVCDKKFKGVPKKNKKSILIGVFERKASPALILRK